MTWFVCGLVAVNLTLCVVHSRMAAKYRRMIRGHREASRNRDDSDFATTAAQSAAIGEASRTGSSSGLTETFADVPIIGYKCASLEWRAGGVFALTSFGGGFSGHTVSADADARCLSRDYSSRTGMPLPVHDAPGVFCTCGFHAVRALDEAQANGYGLVTLDVELSGRVVVHERGYRAQHQRVLRVHLPRCWFCGDESSVVWLVGDERSMPRPLCAGHAAHGEVTVPIEKVMSQFGLPWEREEAQL